MWALDWPEARSSSWGTFVQLRGVTRVAGHGQSGVVGSEQQQQCPGSLGVFAAGICSLQPNWGAALTCLLCRKAEAILGNANLGLAMGKGFQHLLP